MSVRVLVVAISLVFVARSSAEIAAQTCDPPWSGTSIHAATTTVGHVVALLGPDKQVRVNEWNETTKSWSGWTVLPPMENETPQELWVQARVVGFSQPLPGQQEDHNIFARSESGKIIQWTISFWRSQGKLAWSDPKTIPEGEQVRGRLASGETGTGFTGTERQKLFAIFADGTIRSRTWNGTSWSAWLYEGLGGLVGSPWVTQLPSGKINLFVRTVEGKIWQKSWNGAAWSVWVHVNPLGSETGRIDSDPAVVYAPRLGHRLFAATDLRVPTVSQTGVISSIVRNVYAQSYYAVNTWTDWSNAGWWWESTKESFVPVVSGTKVAFYGIEAGRYVWGYNPGSYSNLLSSCSF